MSGNDLITLLTWWLWLLGITLLFLPLSTHIFRSFADKGYIFTKTLAIILISYAMFILGILHILQFDRVSLFFILALPLIIYAVLLSKKPGFRKNISSYFKEISPYKTIFFIEELLFLNGLYFLAYIRAFAPDIHGLEKYMDFGFINSIGRSIYFPPKDMWLPPEPINYYYFGHLATAVLTKLTAMPSSLTYNLMLATIFGLCFVSGFSLAGNLTAYFKGMKTLFSKRILIAAILAAFLLTLGGNLHTMYTFFTPYQNESPVPPWQLAFSPSTFPNSYWYPNATRFIHNTIHEFPIYSWTVADLHGHVLDIPFVLLMLALLFALFQRSGASKLKEKMYSVFGLFNAPSLTFFYVFTGFLLAVMYMTNAWDGIIYLLLSFFVMLLIHKDSFTTKPLRDQRGSITAFLKANISYLKKCGFGLLTIILSYVVFVEPFNHFFKPFVSGVGILCAPSFLTKIGHFGPLLFEVDHCQHSYWWQLLILYGFFYFFVISFLIFLYKTASTKRSDFFVLIIILVSTLLILIPEFIYAKDIYPAHYRANTMFKLVFQAFMMLSISCAYIFVRIIGFMKDYFFAYTRPLRKIGFLIYGGVTVALITLVMIYPYLALTSYYGNLQNYSGIDGVTYLKNLHPSDYPLIAWMNEHIEGQPVVLEAQGDSYTDYARISANTGLPTILGWTVHEWLWRGQYDYSPTDTHRTTDKTPYYPAPRIGDVATLYEGTDQQTTRDLIAKYNVQYVIVGDLEREKYPKLSEDKFKSLGKVIYRNGNTRLYKLN